MPKKQVICLNCSKLTRSASGWCQTCSPLLHRPRPDLSDNNKLRAERWTTNRPDSKVCPRCRQDKSLVEFSTRSSRINTQPSTYCKLCKNELSKEYNNKLGPEERTRRNWLSDIRKNYGLTEEAYNRMYFSQQGACAVCNTKERELVVDHDHSCCPKRRTCGKCVRGLVCTPCNVKLGVVEDSKWNFSAKSYLGRNLYNPEMITG